MERNPWPVETCPVCGTRWTRTCRRDEWGYWYNSSAMQIESRLTLFCSGECAQKYADDRLRSVALRISRTKAYRAWKMRRAGMTLSTIGRELHVGLKSAESMIRNLEEIHWPELRWLDRHPEEVSA